MHSSIHSSLNMFIYIANKRASIRRAYPIHDNSEGILNLREEVILNNLLTLVITFHRIFRFVIYRPFIYWDTPNWSFSTFRNCTYQWRRKPIESVCVVGARLIKNLDKQEKNKIMKCLTLQKKWRAKPPPPPGSDAYAYKWT